VKQIWALARAPNGQAGRLPEGSCRLQLRSRPALEVTAGSALDVASRNKPSSGLLKLPNELVEAGDTCAESLGVTRAEYIRRAIDRMNHETARAQRARDLMTASKKVRAESARVNAEFDVIEGDVET